MTASMPSSCCAVEGCSEDNRQIRGETFVLLYCECGVMVVGEGDCCVGEVVGSLCMMALN